MHAQNTFKHSKPIKSVQFGALQSCLLKFLTFLSALLVL